MIYSKSLKFLFQILKVSTKKKNYQILTKQNRWNRDRENSSPTLYLASEGMGKNEQTRSTKFPFTTIFAPSNPSRKSFTE